MKNEIIYVVRHGEATGNNPEDPLTDTGLVQAKQLAAFLKPKLEGENAQIITSPYLRAVQTTEEICALMNKRFITNPLLRERKLGNTGGLSDEQRLFQLKEQFDHPELSFPGGESNLDVTKRVKEFLEKITANDQSVFILVSHRLTITLLLHEFEESFGFEKFQTITNPDVYLVETTTDGNTEVQRIWETSAEMLTR